MAWPDQCSWLVSLDLIPCYLFDWLFYLDLLLCRNAYVQVETEVFDKIDDLVSRGQGDEEYKEMFHEM